MKKLLLFALSVITLQIVTAQNAPTATTGSPGAVGDSYAQVTGTVNANGSSATVSFQYGRTAAYGNTISGSPNPVTGNSNTAVSATITGLVANQGYHYRVVAQNAGGTTYGNDMVFYTIANTPFAPTVSNPTSTTLDVAIRGDDGNQFSQTYVIRETSTGKYVQADGSLGTDPVFFEKKEKLLQAFHQIPLIHFR